MRKTLSKIKNRALKRRHRRQLSIRKIVNGTEERPRICATKTNKHLHVQVIDDVNSKTIFSVQTYGKKAVEGAAGNVEGAILVGKRIAEEMKEKNITKAVFDRNGYKYTGIISKLVENIKENGIHI